MGFNNVMSYLKCGGCGYKASASQFVDGICPQCGYEGQFPVQED